MVVVFIVTKINYLMVCLFFDLVIFFLPTLVYLWYLSLAALIPCFPRSDKSCYVFSNVIHHIQIGAYQAKLVSHKIFLLSLVIQIERLVVLF